MTNAILRRVGIAAAKLGALVIVLGATTFSVRAAHRFATTSPHLAIASIVIHGNERASEREILALLGIAAGDNLLLADVAAAEAGLADHPWVERASVRRSFPQGLEVEVLEREATALVDLGHLYLVDRTGKVFKRVLPGDPLDLPVLTGLSREEWSERSDEARGKLRTLLEALEIYAESDLGQRLPISEIHSDDAEGLTLYLGDRGLVVKLGEGDVERKLARLALVVTFAERRGEQLELVRLDDRKNPGRIAARLSEGGERLQASLRGAKAGTAQGG